ncbi:hypothetical protein PROFUN_10409 [Planoprotostelium fungivorum]|uniref:TFIIS central domain-containing protein n=1 Tax=Planoprotostelium fungivorum TaxID=1890364 RepID=A0A2P6NE25_9EUKA|nr:hypothetical protein PROFUN_10409 [Planoprotostelium fungivorum]
MSNQDLRETARAKFTEALSSHGDATLSASQLGQLSAAIEEHVFNHNGGFSHGYTQQCRSLIFNLKNPQNNLYRNLFNGSVTPEQLCNMDHNQLAPESVRHEREQEEKEILEHVVLPEHDEILENRRYVAGQWINTSDAMQADIGSSSDQQYGEM